MIDERFLRPAEVDLLVGDPAKAHSVLGWQREVDFPGLVDHDGRGRHGPGPQEPPVNGRGPPRSSYLVPAAISADPAGVLVAFGAGILSFVSPCVLPLVPGYVSMVSGLSAAELEADGDGATPSAALRPVLRGIGLFVRASPWSSSRSARRPRASGASCTAHEVAAGPASAAPSSSCSGVVMLLGALPARVWAHAGRGTLGVVSRVTGEHRFDVRPSRLGGWAAPRHGHGLRLRLDALHRPGARRRARAGQPQRHAGRAASSSSSPTRSGWRVPFVLVGLAFGRFTAVAGPGPALAVGRRARRRASCSSSSACSS